MRTHGPYKLFYWCFSKFWEVRVRYLDIRNQFQNIIVNQNKYSSLTVNFNFNIGFYLLSLSCFTKYNLKNEKNNDNQKIIIKHIYPHFTLFFNCKIKNLSNQYFLKNENKLGVIRWLTFNKENKLKSMKKNLKYMKNNYDIEYWK